MIPFFGGNISFLLPGAFVVSAAAGLGVLVYAYLRRGRLKKVIVSSTLFLKFLENMPRARRRFIPPWRFFLEALLLIFLAASLGGLYFSGGGKDVALLIDNSASMQARPVAGSKSLFEEAVKKAETEISGADWGSRFKVYVTSPSFKQLSGEYLSAGEARSLLSEIRPSSTRDNIEASLGNLLLKRDFEKLLVLTDKALRNADPDISWFNARSVVAGDFSNVSLAAFRQSRDFVNGREFLEISLQSHGSSDLNVRVSVSGCKTFTDCRNPLKIAEKDATLKAGGSEMVRFEAPASAQFAYLAEIKEVRFSGKIYNDALAVDNSAWLLRDIQKAKLLLVGSLSPGSLGLQNIPATAIEHLSPERYRQNPPQAGDFKAFIFHGYLPENLPAVNVILVRPPNNPFFAVRSTATDVPVSNWKRGHPLLSYLNLSSLRFRKLEPLAVPSVLEGLISTPAGSAAFAGELNGKKIAAFGFELFPYEGRKSPLLSVLLLNTLKWATNLSAEAGFHRLDYPLNLPERNITSAVSSDGVELVNQETLKLGELFIEKPGLVKLSGPGAKAVFEAARFYNPEESNLTEIKEVILPDDSRLQETTGKDGSSIYSRYLAWIVFFVLLVDLIFQLVNGSGIKRRLRPAA